MNDHSDDDVEDQHGRRDREITLGTTMVLGIFFALAVFGAVCVGFGYSLGAKHATSIAGTAGTQGGSTSSFNGFKPPAGMTGAAGKPGNIEQANVAYTPPPVPLARTVVPLERPVAPFPATAEPAQPGAAVTARPATASAVSATTPAPAGAMMVQVAAVSHQEDADLLVSTLKRRNYSVAIHQEPADKLLHVQVGPFTNRKDADAMRLRLQADGFNAIVKDTSR